jgi:hypothetical protein
MLLISGKITTCNAEKSVQYTQKTEVGILHLRIYLCGSPPSSPPPPGSWSDYSWGLGIENSKSDSFYFSRPNKFIVTPIGIPHTYLNMYSLVTKKWLKNTGFS